MYPNTALHAKVLADAIGAHKDSVKNWLSLGATPNMETAQRMAEFFANMGDRSFIPEVFGPDVVPFAALPPAEDVARTIADVLRAQRLAA